MVEKEKKILRVEKAFASHITSLTIGTVRGMLHAKTEQTIFNLIYIPVMNVDHFFEKDLVLES